MLTQSQWDTLLTPVIYHHFGVGMNMVPSMRTRLFNVQGSLLAEEKGTGIGGFSVDAWNQYKNSGQKGSLDLNQLYTKTYTHLEYPVKLRIEKKLLLNDQYSIINQIVRRAGISAEQKMEIDAASVLNNAFDSNYTGADAVSLCSASHPAGPSASATLQSNTGTKALTEAAVSETRVTMMRFKDDKNNEIGLTPNELWVPPELEDKALKIVRSTNEPGTANNDANAQAGRWTVVPWQRLTGTKAWFMVDSVWRQEVVNWYNREVVVPMLVAEDTTHLTYELKLHYSYGFDDWRWIFGHNPS